MDSNASGFFLNHSIFFQGEEDDGIIDLGLSLKTSHPQAYPPSGHLIGQEGYDEVIEWAQGNQSHSAEECEEEAEVVQSKESWGYVKVNMDGVVVGRKIYILNYGDYSSLALQLEDMFGRQRCESGLRLFHPGSEFCLFYKDRENNWRTVGDVPWKEFEECVKRLRIARRN